MTRRVTCHKPIPTRNSMALRESFRRSLHQTTPRDVAAQVISMPSDMTCFRADSDIKTYKLKYR